MIWKLTRISLTPGIMHVIAKKNYEKRKSPYKVRNVYHFRYTMFSDNDVHVCKPHLKGFTSNKPESLTKSPQHQSHSMGASSHGEAAVAISCIQWCQETRSLQNRNS